MGSDRDGASAQFRTLARSPRSELEQIVATGEAPSIAALVGHEYRGYNTPRMTALLRIRTFIKVFFTDPEGGAAMGANTPVHQNGLDGAWAARPDEDHPRRYAFFAVTPVDPRAHPGALLLDYGAGNNRPWDVARLLRAELVRVAPGSDELLLGKAHLALGPARPAVGFFVLERRRPAPDAAALELSRAR